MQGTFSLEKTFEERQHDVIFITLKTYLVVKKFQGNDSSLYNGRVRYFVENNFQFAMENVVSTTESKVSIIEMNGQLVMLEWFLRNIWGLEIIQNNCGLQLQVVVTPPRNSFWLTWLINLTSKKIAIEDCSSMGCQRDSRCAMQYSCRASGDPARTSKFNYAPAHIKLRLVIKNELQGYYMLLHLKISRLHPFTISSSSQATIPTDGWQSWRTTDRLLYTQHKMCEKSKSVVVLIQRMLSLY